jgi:DNA polymerase-3 subunit beta
MAHSLDPSHPAFQSDFHLAITLLDTQESSLSASAAVLHARLLARIRLRHLQLLVAIADHGTLKRAAEQVGMSQPAATQAIRELERLLSGRPSDEPLSLFSERGQVVVLWADQVLTSRTIDGTYPNYRQLLPETFNRRLVLDRRAFTASLERVAVLADQHNNVVKISSDPAAGQVLIRADAQDVGSGSESLAASIEGDPIDIAFNVRYLLDGLKVMGGSEVVLKCNAPTTPAVLEPVGEPDAFVYLVMPVQIRT